MNKLRETFKKQAQENEPLFLQVLADDYDKLWNLVAKCNERVGICRDLAYDDTNKSLMLVMLSNCISDLLCCLDSLERGHEQTVQNNLRMIFEGCCLVFHLFDDRSLATLGKFKTGRHNTPDSVTYATSKSERFKQFGKLYGEMSNISHQSKFELVARQMVKQPQGFAFAHIKPINPDRFVNQTSCLLMVMYLLRSIAELAEEICIDLFKAPYFLEKVENGFQKKLDTPEDGFIQNFAKRAEAIFQSNECT